MDELERIETQADCAEAGWNLWRFGFSGGYLMGGRGDQ